MNETLHLRTDVLVVGGGPAATWAALRARRAGAEVVLVDKGYCGSSGATAPSGTGVWFVEPDPAVREGEMAQREALGGHLSERPWMERVLDETYASMHELGEVGRYPFPADPAGGLIRRGVQGPEYMRRMRAWVRRIGVQVIDHAPVLELLVDHAGAVRGAAGVLRQRSTPYAVTAGAVVLATGGCAFLSSALGTNVNTGDGHLMAAEVGATMSGMEFSNAYAITLAGSSITKTAFYEFARFYREDGSLLEGAGSTRGRSVIAAALLDGPVLARLDKADAETRIAMRLAQPNFFLQFDRRAIDPFEQMFAIDLLAEGTVRGTGGVDLLGDDCRTGVDGLYVAGDLATRERVCGGFTGGGSRNAAWAISSGGWAGAAAAAHAREAGAATAPSALLPTGRTGLRPTGGAPVRPEEVLRSAQDELLPLAKNYLRHGDRLSRSADQLDAVWSGAAAGLRPEGAAVVRAREVAAITAVGRWMYRSALVRTESRGMAKRADFGDLDPGQRHHIVSGGLDRVWTRTAAAAVGAPA